MFELSPSGWSERSLLELGSYVNGYAFKPDDWSEDGLPIVRIAQITGSSDTCDHYPNILSDTYKIKNGDIIFSWSGTLAVVKWSGGPAWLNQHLFRVDHAADVAPEFLYHLLIASVAEMDKRSHGSTMKHIKRGELSEYRAPVPNSMHEQQKIAQILDTLDTQIYQTEAVITKLEHIKQGLLTDLLTRGIDQSGQLRPAPEQAPNLYKESPLGWIPRNWECKCLSEIVCRITYGFTNPMPATDDGPWMVTAADIEAGSIKYDSARHTSYHAFSMLTNKSRPQINDVLITKDGTLGRVAIVDREDICINQSVAAIKPRFVDVNGFLLSYLQSNEGQRRILADAGGSTIKHLYITKLGNLLVPWPRIDESIESTKRIDAMDSRLRGERESLEKLRAQKSGLMDDLLTGRVRVSALL